ncbi:glycosyltransferase [Paraclostridium bifermentans]|uniref:Glycosyltransferase n=1 Tax=Paraclostridium bifermentans TaxID=1490 RepID=A0AA44DHI1_PARBF|nr:glycosyltransferase [Paraclostridium bifermentans]MBN8048526.1 glycosyltransferase [Paraclostridium bifermentans]NME07880.1 glycosyltransferase [Paraclostridium bifermentans]
MKKISLLCYNIMTTGGVEKVAMTVANDLANRGIEVEIVYMRKGRNTDENCFDKRVKFKQLTSEKSSKCIGEIREYLKSSNIDAIISFGRHINNSLMLASVGLKSKPTLVLTEHGNPRMAESLAKNNISKFKIKLTNKLSKILYKKADRIVAVSNSLGEILREEIKNCKIDVIYNPVIDENFYIKSEKYINEFPYTQSIKPIVVTVGRLSEVKNHKLLIDAFKIVLESRDAYLVLVGDGELEGELLKKIQNLGLENNIFILGYKENPYPYIKQADTFVLSSKTESFGLVLVEALALNTNVVSTDCEVGPREILQDGKFGLLCEQDANELAKAINSSLEKERYVNDNDEYINKYLQQFKVEKVVDKYLKII